MLLCYDCHVFLHMRCDGSFPPDPLDHRMDSLVDQFGHECVQVEAAMRQYIHPRPLAADLVYGIHGPQDARTRIAGRLSPFTMRLLAKCPSLDQK